VVVVVFGDAIRLPIATPTKTRAMLPRAKPIQRLRFGCPWSAETSTRCEATGYFTVLPRLSKNEMIAGAAPTKNAAAAATRVPRRPTPAW
jgi:hypothetical protein